MNGQHIPGFYFDKEKGKYFKIQSQSQARGLNLKYSTSNLVKERRKENIQKAVTAKSKRIQRERVVRRHARSFIQTDLDREIGFKRQSVYMRDIWPEACMSGVSSSPEPVTSSDDQGVIRFFDRDPVSRTIYAVCGENGIMRRHYLGNDQAVNLRNYESRKKLKALDTSSRYGYYPWDEIGRTTSTVSSLQYMPNSGALAVTTIGSDRPPIVHLSDPERDGPHIYQKFTPKACAAIFCSAARPYSYSPPSSHPNSVAANDTECLAVGAQQSLLFFTRSPSGTWDSLTILKDLHSDILALSWLSHTTLALGCRNGKIHLHDTRSGGVSHALTHPYAISRLARADDPTRLICSGLQDTLYLYDLRMPRLSNVRLQDGKPNTKNHHYNDAYFKSLYPGDRDYKRRKQMNRRAFGKWSQPLLSFPHTNLDDLDLDVAVNERLGLIAACQDVEHCDKAIRVSNMWTGKTVKEFEAPRMEGQKPQKIRNLKWMDDGDEGISLWSTWGRGIASFAW
ncbi:WD40-repeat-containing domain protein [Boeremia exigua]|uniref:WD40-repeat-containing domain protein n=1 Tax=Boeremia exigua TaxID=749465 RepID=UPI001E8CF718|nr:WD40-repeat-containing domain protein [Boeremia exigua]KAH6642396.1 WD40-repeat-containing domain protein [Boeremia exigua]